MKNIIKVGKTLPIRSCRLKMTEIKYIILGEDTDEMVK